MNQTKTGVFTRIVGAGDSVQYEHEGETRTILVKNTFMGLAPGDRVEFEIRIGPFGEDRAFVFGKVAESWDQVGTPAFNHGAEVTVVF